MEAVFWRSVDLSQIVWTVSRLSVDLSWVACSLKTKISEQIALGKKFWTFKHILGSCSLKTPFCDSVEVVFWRSVDLSQIVWSVSRLSVDLSWVACSLKT